MILPRSFYARDTVTVARELLGKVLVHREGAGRTTSGIIAETEAYPGGDDLASHSAAGITDRTRVIFGPPGHAYVYLSYGMHECMNIVTESAGKPGAVLIRALEPLAGIEIMRARRPRARSDRDLANGPGKLTMALGIARNANGQDLTRGSLTVHTHGPEVPFDIAVTPRIGITKCADLSLRFLKLGSR
jgi:DNA-3-methyladenine glycosylase